MKTSETVEHVQATVALVTKNRKEELRKALESAVAQTVPCEVLVVDDGSTDGTAAMVAEEFPTAQLVRHETSRGYIVRRNEAAQLARGEVIVSIDDDAAFSTPDVVAHTLREFDEPRVGAVAIPFVNVLCGPEVLQRAPDPAQISVTANYIGTAHAVRRNLFLAAGGYPEYLGHYGEEADFCIRLLERGYVTRLGTAPVIHHFHSPKRDGRRLSIYAPRSAVLFTWCNVPQPYFGPRLVLNSGKALWDGVRYRVPLYKLQGLAAGYRAMWDQFTARRPVSRTTYKLFQLLRARKSLPLETIRPLLPPLR